jgi:hypothetical protein
MDLFSNSYKLVPRINDLWNFYLKSYEGKENRIIEDSLTILSKNSGIIKEDLKLFLENFDESKLNQQEKSVIEEFYMIFYENMLIDPDFREKLIATRLRHYEFSLNEIKELLTSIKDINYHKESNDKKIYIDIIKSELEYCISVLEQSNVKLLPIDKWMSAVNSGSLMLFKVDTELKSLSTIYDKIRDFNDRARIQKFIGYSWDRLKREEGYRLPLFQVRQFLEIREWLLVELNILKDSEWLNLSK